jgi:hypothetical protein
MPPTLTDHTIHLPWSRADTVCYQMYIKHRHELRHARKAHGLLLPVDPGLLSGSDKDRQVNLCTLDFLSYAGNIEVAHTKPKGRL